MIIHINLVSYSNLTFMDTSCFFHLCSEKKEACSSLFEREKEKAHFSWNLHKKYPRGFWGHMRLLVVSDSVSVIIPHSNKLWLCLYRSQKTWTQISLINVGFRRLGSCFGLGGISTASKRVVCDIKLKLQGEHGLWSQNYYKWVKVGVNVWNIFKSAFQGEFF